MSVVDPVTGRDVLLLDAFSYNGSYKVRATGYSGQAIAGTTTNLDFAVGLVDRYIQGTMLILKNHVWGDTMNLKIVDVNGVLSPAGTVLNQFGFDWNVNDQQQIQGPNTFNYLARLYAGLFIRISYTSVGARDVDVKLNCFMHEKIV